MRPILSVVPLNLGPAKPDESAGAAKARVGGIVAAVVFVLGLLVAIIVLAVLLSKSNADNDRARANAATAAAAAAAAAAPGAAGSPAAACDACAGVWPVDRRECDYVIVGAGPAGLADADDLARALIAAGTARARVSVCVVEARAAVGGNLRKLDVRQPAAYDGR
jgi:hypothetical protein